MAVVVIEGSPEQNTGTLSGLGEIWAFFANNWVLMVSVLVILLLVGIVFFIWKRLSDERKERDDKVYLHYINVHESCVANSRTEWIRKYWNPVSLWLVLLPVIGWFIIPFVKKESSNKIRDIDNNFVGWYRGHSFLDDGTVALFYYKTKSFIFFEDTKILLIPTSIAVNSFDEDKNPVLEHEKISPVNFSDSGIKVSMTGTRKRGMYFWFPILVNHDRNPIHLSSTIIENLKSSTGYEVVESLTSDFSKQIQKAVNISADVRKSQETDTPTKDVQQE